MQFALGHQYSRADVKAIAGLPRSSKGGDWDTGIVEHAGVFMIFTNVGTEGRTGHDYANAWEGAALRWFHKRGSHLGWKSVDRLLAPGAQIHVFWRTDNESPFTYAGAASPIEVADTSPVEILWAFVGDHGRVLIRNPDEPRQLNYSEGSVRRVTVNAYERDPRARRACIEHYGARCIVCSVSFEARYGAAGLGFIHVHHLVPLAEVGQTYEVDAINDLRPVCPNCHAMLHRRQPPFTIDEVRSYMKDACAARARKGLQTDGDT